MEDAPRHKITGRKSKKEFVLILVVMEDAPRLMFSHSIYSLEECLNPCCNGRCSPTYEKSMCINYRLSLNPCCNGRCSPTPKL